MLLYGHQIKALKEMHNGCILCGGVGTGKSLTALAYYHTSCGGTLKIDGKGRFGRMKKPRPLYIITTAKKRDDGDWIIECAKMYCADLATVDSWNNIKKYTKVTGAFFIFDEQRVSGRGAWVKAFLNIARKNKWILLSATPGDTWEDYIPVFVANGYYKNRKEFCDRHAIYSPFRNYPKIERWLEEDVLEELRNQILVAMPYEKRTVPHHIDIKVWYKRAMYKTVWKDRWDPYEDCPIKETGMLFYLLRKVVNEDPSRIEACEQILDEHKKAIIFYNFTFELELLRKMCKRRKLKYAEWNGEKHEPIPTGKAWVYLVQYRAGAEGWNCISTDTLIFYSQSYSYRDTIQAAGRIDRLNTPYEDLYYFHLKSYAPIDLAIAKSLKNKKNFNEKAFLGQKK